MATADHQLPQAVSTTDVWNAALAAVREADARMRPVVDVFNRAERAYFALQTSVQSGDRRVEDLAVAYDEIGLDEACANERHCSEALHEAATRLYHTTAPDLTALIEKVELIERVGYDGKIEPLILADLRRLVEQMRDDGFAFT